MHTQAVLKQRTDQSLTLKTITVWLLFFLLFPVLTNASIILRIEPEFPVAGEPVSLYYFGCEPPFSHVESGELFYTERTDSLVQFVGFFTYSLPLCPFPSEYTYDLGVFEAGEFDLEIYLFLANFILPLDLSTWTPNEILPFTVSPPPRPVSSTGFLGLGLLILLMLSLTHSVFKNKSVRVGD